MCIASEGYSTEVSHMQSSTVFKYFYLSCQTCPQWLDTFKVITVSVCKLLNGCVHEENNKHIRE